MLEHGTGAAWNVRDKLCIVSGATNGIGKQTALALASQGARVVVVARSPAKGDATVSQISEATSDNKVELRQIKTERAVGNRWLVSEGLQPGDRVITEGLQFIRPGVEVNPQPAGNVKQAGQSDAQAGTAAAGQEE